MHDKTIESVDLTQNEISSQKLTGDSRNNSVESVCEKVKVYIMDEKQTQEIIDLTEEEHNEIFPDTQNIPKEPLNSVESSNGNVEKVSSIQIHSNEILQGSFIGLLEQMVNSYPQHIPNSTNEKQIETIDLTEKVSTDILEEKMLNIDTLNNQKCTNEKEIDTVDLTEEVSDEILHESIDQSSEQKSGSMCDKSTDLSDSKDIESYEVFVKGLQPLLKICCQNNLKEETYTSKGDRRNMKTEKILKEELFDAKIKKVNKKKSKLKKNQTKLRDNKSASLENNSGNNSEKLETAGLKKTEETETYKSIGEIQMEESFHEMTMRNGTFLKGQLNIGKTLENSWMKIDPYIFGTGTHRLARMLNYSIKSISRPVSKGSVCCDIKNPQIEALF